MKMPAPIWTMRYSASRRKHHHRCRACSRIVRDGDAVLMARVRGNKTKVIHEACAPLDTGVGVTEGELLRLHGLEYLASCGWREANRILDEQRERRVAL